MSKPCASVERTHKGKSIALAKHKHKEHRAVNLTAQRTPERRETEKAHRQRGGIAPAGALRLPFTDLRRKENGNGEVP